MKGPWAAVVLGTAVRVLLCGLIGLSVDESYAVVMSRRVALSYYDHPPMLFWLPRLAAWLAGSESRYVVRAPFILLFALTTWVLCLAAARLFGERAGAWSAVLLNLILFFTLCAGGWVLPDGPLLFFSALALLCLVRVLFEELSDAAAWGGWMAFGLCAGLALLSKYHGVLLLAGAALFLATSPPHRAWLRRPQPWAAAALAVLVFLPVLVWNARHGWASFRFQGGRAMPATEAEGTPFVDTILGQAAWMLPWLWVPLVAVLWRALRTGPRDPRRWLLACLALGPIAGFTLLTIVGSRGLPHWEAPGYFMLVPLLGASVAARLDAGDRATRRWVAACVAGLALVLGVLVTHVRTGWISRVRPGLLAKGDPTSDLLDWTALRPALAQWGYPREGVAIAGDSWADAAKAAYALGPGVPVVCVGADPRGFYYSARPDTLVGRDIVFVARRRPGWEAIVRFAPYFEHVSALGSVPITRAGHPDVDVSVYLGRRLLRPLPLVHPF